MKRPSQSARLRKDGASSKAIVAVLRGIPKGETRTKMEVFRKVLQELDRGDEGIDTGIRAQLGSQLIAVVNKRVRGWHRVVSSDGGLWDAKEQLALLQAEGARPRPGEAVRRWAKRCKATLVGTYRASSGRVALARHDPRVDKWRPEEVEPLRNKAVLKERLVLSGGKLFHHPDMHKPQPPAFCCKTMSRAKPCRTLTAALKRVRPRLQHALANAQFAELTRKGAVCIRNVLQSQECSQLLHFAAGANFSDVRRLDGEAGRGGAYHFCDGSAPLLVEAIRTSLYESILAHSPSLAQRYGRTLADLEKRCRAAGQLQAKLLFLGPSLLLLCQPVLRRRCATIFLAFGEGGVNLAHQDPYGSLFFPYQAVLMLSRRGQDFNGGEFFVKNMKSGQVVEVAASEGDVTVFAANSAAVQGSDFKHGVREVHGNRFSVGIVFNLRK
ncbi:unnamed protein product [Symbiodinium natans]|uniref:Fe2OG dioxygenase domain-containing protein n=1 Tax=Symbiodinium natans TaxID=878477 RepID=A0A812U562_9DINO|nr:unnamed protein product [Symbiodinium natans]